MSKEVNVEEGLAIRKEEQPETASCVTPVTTKQEDCDMHRRFSVNEDEHIIDMLNPANAGSSYSYDLPGARDDEMFLREQVLSHRLIHLVDDLIINTNPMKELPTGEMYQPSCEERSSIWCAIVDVIRASHLNTLDVGLSLQHRFSGELKREKIDWSDYSSLSFFVDDVERVLRDLYGEADNEAIDRVRYAVLRVVEGITRFSRVDLWQEHDNARDYDYVFSEGPLRGLCWGSSDFRHALNAEYKLGLRARAVRANPKAFSKYTVEFVNKSFSQPMEDAGLSEEVQRSEEGKPSEEVKPWKEPF
jgi:hypothetical protein